MSEYRKGGKVLWPKVESWNIQRDRKFFLANEPLCKEVFDRIEEIENHLDLVGVRTQYRMTDDALGVIDYDDPQKLCQWITTSSSHEWDADPEHWEAVIALFCRRRQAALERDMADGSLR